MAGTGVECGGWVDGTALNVATTMYFFLYSGLYFYQKDLLELETPTVSPMFRTLGIESVNMRTDNQCLNFSGPNPNTWATFGTVPCQWQHRPMISLSFASSCGRVPEVGFPRQRIGES